MRSAGQRKSRLQENRIAKDIGGRRQKASGATDFAKGDVRKQGDIRVEAKTTGARTFILKLSDVNKIREEALLGGAEEWAMQVEFQGQMGANRKFAIIDWNRFMQLRKLIETVEQHKQNVWGEGPINNDEDFSLYQEAGVLG